MAEFFAHTTPNPNRSDWEPLRDHLERVAARTADFAEDFGSREWGRLAGLWHDLGKYHPRFQQRLGDATIRQPHSGAGAALALDKDRQGFLAWVIAGHHAGLANRQDLRARMEAALAQEWPGTLPNVPEDLLKEAPSGLPDPPRAGRLQAEMWIRILFSALVDADRLCTEDFYDPRKPEQRSGTRAPLVELTRRLDEEMVRLSMSLTSEARELPINQARTRISEACLTASGLSPGLFSLTVPTGGGKTLAAMRFALHHACNHDLRRVIVVIPYTSIIEQNAARYARIFGPTNVVEHHSNLDVERRRRETGDAVVDWQDLAAENWDAPIIVTTTVQFFESLFTNHPSRARKLHNVARSVVVLDEVQSLPPEFLHTILDGLGQLALWYGTTVVLSTATPPALRWRESLNFGLKGVREIIDDPGGLAETLRRVRYEWPVPDSGKKEWGDLAAEIGGHRQALVVVHRRADARELAELLVRQANSADVLHLSALMCPAHRLEVLGEVRHRLANGLPCLLVSTQLIEAGVDVDFPVVYRALAGLDSIVQAAGRCNREGHLESGRVVVFEAKSCPPRGVPRKGLEATQVLLKAAHADGTTLQPDDPATQESFFRSLYGAVNTDAKSIQSDRSEMDFATVAKKFKLIEDGFTQTIIVPYGEAGRLVGELTTAFQRGEANLRDRFRALQPYTVTVYEQAFQKAEQAGALWDVCEGLHMLRQEFAHHYHEKYGLVIGDEIGIMDLGKLLV